MVIWGMRFTKALLFVSLLDTDSCTYVFQLLLFCYFFLFQISFTLLFSQLHFNTFCGYGQTQISLFFFLLFDSTRKSSYAALLFLLYIICRLMQLLITFFSCIRFDQHTFTFHVLHAARRLHSHSMFTFYFLKIFGEW